MTGDRGHTSRATRTGGSYAYPGSFRLSPDEQDVAQPAFCRLKGRSEATPIGAPDRKHRLGKTGGSAVLPPVPPRSLESFSLGLPGLQ